MCLSDPLCFRRKSSRAASRAREYEAGSEPRYRAAAGAHPSHRPAGAQMKNRRCARCANFEKGIGYTIQRGSESKQPARRREDDDKQEK